MAIARQGWRHAKTYTARRVLISMEIPSKDKSFAWFMDWMAKKEGKGTQHVSVETNFHQFENGEITTRTRLVPSPGVHYFRYKVRNRK